MPLLAKDLNDVNDSLRKIDNFIANFKNNNWNLQGYKIINSGPSRDDYDLVTRYELFKNITIIKDDLQSKVDRASTRLDDIERRLKAAGVA